MFTKEETKYLIKLVDKYAIIKNKSKVTEVLDVKREAWKIVTTEFNAKFKGTRKQNTSQLKTRYEYLEKCPTLRRRFATVVKHKKNLSRKRNKPNIMTLDIDILEDSREIKDKEQETIVILSDDEDNSVPSLNETSENVKPRARVLQETKTQDGQQTQVSSNMQARSPSKRKSIKDLYDRSILQRIKRKYKKRGQNQTSQSNENSTEELNCIELINTKYKELLNEERAQTLIREIAAERVRINEILSGCGIPNMRFKLYASHKLLEGQLNERFEKTEAIYKRLNVKELW